MPDQRATKYNISIDAKVQYIEEQSSPNENRYVFSYTINILKL